MNPANSKKKKHRSTYDHEKWKQINLLIPRSWQPIIDRLTSESGEADAVELRRLLKIGIDTVEAQ